MKRFAIAAGITVLVTMGYLATRPPKPDFWDRMEYPVGLAETVGDEHGGVCHQLRDKDDHLVASHFVWDKDFSRMTEAEKQAHFKADARTDWKNSGGGNLACGDAAGSGIFQSAYAQPHCDDCGGNCHPVSCPAHIGTGGGCINGGPNCVITRICCTAQCGC